MPVLKVRNLKARCLSFFVISMLLSASAYAKDIRIALRAHQGAVKSLSLWQATADHLTKNIPEHRFILVPFENISVMNQAVSRGDFPFIIANPSSVVEYNLLYNTTPIASLVNKRQGKGYTKFGAVIFTRADRDDIIGLDDVKNKSIISVDELAFGGWRVAWKEFLDNGIYPYTDFEVVRFAGGTQHDVVYAVRDGKDDVGVVRTDMLERMAESGQIELKNFKVLGNKTANDFPFFLSTKLYPEWAISSVSDIDVSLKNKVFKALRLISSNHKAAIDGQYIKWVKPLNYTSVDELLKDLKVGPYDISTLDPFDSLINQYGYVVAIAILIINILVIAFLYMLKLNRKILQAKNELKEESNVRSKLEKQLLQAQKIESLGQLTGGIAHDFNNMLGSIVGFTELSLNTKKIKEDKKLTSYLEQVMIASDRCTSLISQMLAFSKAAGDTNVKEDVLVFNFLEDVKLLLKPMLPSNFQLNISDVDKSLVFNINPLTLNQVIINLYLNSRDAITKGQGVITLDVSTIKQYTPGNYCDSCHQDINGSYIVLSFTDNGCGINTDLLRHLFDPFYSTKEVGKGTGLGLSIVHGVIHKLGGHITIDSEVNKGTTVKLLFPLVKTEEKQKVIAKKETPATLKNKSSSHILVVDDEIALTVYLSEFLQSHGHKVTSFNSSLEALAYFEKYSEDIDIVITDQTMPGLTGIDMSEKMLAIDSYTSIILCSGFSKELQDKNKSDLNIRYYMDKPIQSNLLLENINSII